MPRPPDDEGQNENLRLIPNPRRRSNLRTPQIRRLNREKTGVQYSPNPHSIAKPDHDRPDRVEDGLGVTNDVCFLRRRSGSGLCWGATRRGIAGRKLTVMLRALTSACAC